MKRTAVSIDWDTFVPEKSEWDIGHSETQFHHDQLWTVRPHLLEAMTTNGEEKTFWERFHRVFDVSDHALIHVSDSHLFAYQELPEDVERLVLIDAHHDAWSLSWDGHIQCDTWVRHWLNERRSNEVVWVQANWPGPKDFGLPPDMHSRFRKGRLRDLEKLIKGGPWACPVHVCRSGCWTPPWLDQAFIDFVAASGLTPVRIEAKGNSGDWDPLTCRWDEQRYQELNRVHRFFDHVGDHHVDQS